VNPRSAFNPEKRKRKCAFPLYLSHPGTLCPIFPRLLEEKRADHLQVAPSVLDSVPIAGKYKSLSLLRVGRTPHMSISYEIKQLTTTRPCSARRTPELDSWEDPEPGVLKGIPLPHAHPCSALHHGDLA
jgi:hypothetical protein